MKSLHVAEYDLKGVKGRIHTIREVIILSFVITSVKATVNLITYSKCMNVVLKPVMGY